ncbi:MAG: DUF4435 domain-containing protein [Okeania sp. SIO3I5]|uniref:DUF4435 domain-containing protein n=1 Tax=Okeania sp. SIO3I5 TaxID=2607805 RepID=UPI0013B5B542|nr:DUF4435 domain-containing protein [Okeania sp. SIO3I5]NEQ36658.1 DUF4435 domain-containing protein [Okeania sp. SIO3I5]
MNFADQLRDARNPGDVYLQFIKNDGKDEKTIHSFFEGDEDISFYSHFIEQILPKNYSSLKYVCKGKQKVYELYKKVIAHISNKTNKSRTLFFVDKDLSDFLNEDLPKYENLYVTDYYSIENFLVIETMIRKICEDFYHITDTTQISEIKSRFQQELKTFYRYLLPIMSWIIYLKKQGYQVNLNNLQMDKLFQLNDDLQICKKQQKNYLKILEKHCGVDTPQKCWIQIKKTVEYLKQYDAKSYIRGKYELWFFVTFINKINIIKDVHNQQLFKSKTQINEGNAIAILAPRIPFPPSLKLFLKKNFKQLNYKSNS